MEIRIPAIAVVQRSFGNTRELEGIRVDAGTRFAVEKPIEGLRTISAERYRQLLRVRLVRPLVEEGVEPIAEHQPAAAAPPAAARVRPTTQSGGEKRGQDPEPPAPKRLDNPAPSPTSPDGSPNGGQGPASLSPADPASSTSSTSSKRRARKPRIAAG